MFVICNIKGREREKQVREYMGGFAVLFPPDLQLVNADFWVLSRIFEHKSGEIAGARRKLHNEQLHNLYSSPNITRIIRSRKLRWTGRVACMGEKRNKYSKTLPVAASK
jgi:hypothetical protein